MRNLIHALAFPQLLFTPDDPPPTTPVADPPAEPAAPTDPPADPPAPAAAKPPEEPAEPETVSVSKAEFDALRRKVAVSEKEKRDAERRAREQEETRQREQGEYQQLAETKAQEAEDLRKRLESAERAQRISKIAARLHFRDPSDVIDRLKPEEADDDILAEAALERIAAEKPYLLDKPEQPKPEIGRVLEPSATPSGTPGNGVPKTVEEYDRMSQNELAALPDEEFQKALKLLKAAGKL